MSTSSPAATIRPVTPATAPAEPGPLERAMAEIDPDALTPRGALDLLYRLKALAADV
jgi:DNA mismatch repair protein MutS